jgi:hypothetical protein
MKRKARIGLLVFAILGLIHAATATLAGSAYQNPASANARVGAVRAANPVIIPFELVARHIMVKVRINNSRPLSFVFDTGDKVGIVDTEVANEIGLKLEGQLRIGGAGADTLPGSFVKEATWTLPGLDGFTQPIILAMPLSRLAARFGHDFDGIIGSDFIKQYVVEVDYQNRVLKLHEKDKFSYSGPGDSIPIQLNQQGFPILEGQFTLVTGESIKGKFVLDLGSGGSLVVLSPVVAEHNLLGNGLKTIKAIGVGGAGGRSTGQIGRIRDLQIGKFKIANPTALFSEDKSGAMAGRALIGNVGQRIASKFRVFLDYSHSRIVLEPNSTFADPMDRAFAGLALTTEGKDRATFRITELLENSPASEAGLQPDDIVLSVDGRTAGELSVTQVLEMFERPQPYKLTIRRGGQSLQVTLTPRKLI